MSVSRYVFPRTYARLTTAWKELLRYAEEKYVTNGYVEDRTQ